MSHPQEPTQRHVSPQAQAPLPENHETENHETLSAANDRPRDDASSSLDFRVSPALVLRVLLTIILTLVVLGTFANYLIYHVASHPDDALATVARRFDLGNEPSIPNWYSSLALLGCSAVLSLIAVRDYRSQAPTAGRWLGMALLFLGLAVDEAVLVHEMVDGLMIQTFELHGIFFFGWVIPGMLFVACLGIYYGKFVWQLPRATRSWFLLSAALFVTGAIGMEMVAGVIIENRGVESIWHTWSQAIEELLEMLGVAVFLYALTDYLSRQTETIRLHLRSTES